MTTLNIPSLDSIHAARERLLGTILCTPLIKFDARSSDFPGITRQGKRSGFNSKETEVSTTPEIYLKLENLQPTGSFKVRGAGNALLVAEPSQLKDGVWTASAGNMGQALAWYAQKLGIACTVVVPDDAPDVKVKAIERLGAQTVKVSFAEYQSIQRESGHPDMRGVLIHPFADEAVMAGNGTIGLEILEELPDVDAILVPYGGGGLSCGIAASIRASRHQARIEAVEVATAAPLTGSFAAGKPVEVSYRSSFISGMGAPFVFPQVWPLASQLLHGSRVVELEQVSEAIRLLAERHHIIVEGAGAVALAAALQIVADSRFQSDCQFKKIVCVVSGGNINTVHLSKILQGEVP